MVYCLNRVRGWRSAASLLTLTRASWRPPQTAWLGARQWWRLSVLSSAQTRGWTGLRPMTPPSVSRLTPSPGGWGSSAATTTTTRSRARCTYPGGNAEGGWSHHNHRYYFRSKCYFMVWSPVGYHLEIIDYDPEFWGAVELILENFYINCLLPEIVDPRAPRGLPIREPDYIVEVCSLRRPLPL